jgi:flagellar hook-basal body complex protein FliE
MTAPIGPISGISPLAGAAPTSAPTAAGGASGANFASVLGHGLDAVSNAQNTANDLAVKAATGTLTDPAQLTIAATQAGLATQLATTLQSKAIAAFNTIMGMQA